MRKTLLLATLFLAPLGIGAVVPAVAAETASGPSLARGPRLDPIGEAAATKTVTLAVENMSCAACPITVRKALEKVPGVASAKVDLDTRTATVSFDPTKTNVGALTRATTEAGYPSKPTR